MHDDANQPPVVPELSHEATRPALGRRDALLLLGIGAAVGLALGIMLMIGAVATVMVFAPPFMSPIKSVQVFNELNELRQQINEFNEQTKLKDMEREAALREALSAVEATAKAPNLRPPEAVPPGSGKPGVSAPGGAVVTESRVEKPNDPFADIDAEVKRLERTQKILNAMLDMLTTNRKEQPKGR